MVSNFSIISDQGSYSKIDVVFTVSIPFLCKIAMHVLSIPTWIIHISSVLEWITAIWLVWSYGDVVGDRTWRWLSWGMLPALVSAMCACTWHFFDNAPSLDWLVTTQAATTALGNSTMCLAAYGIFRRHQPDQNSAPPSKEP